MLNRLSNRAILKVVALVGVLLATLLLASTLSAQDAPIEYPETGIGPVETYAATDADGDAIVWELSGADAGDFNISAGGELNFKASPNFEAPVDSDEDNVYNVTVEAAGGTHDVVVTVTNVDEQGTASLNKPQPQASRSLMASVNDPDGDADDQDWQWARSMDGATGFTDITGATSATRSPVAADVGYYLRASVTYTDMFGAGKTASVVSGNLVEARTVANARPSFGDLDQVDDVTGQEATIGVQVTRTIDENADKGTSIGDPVSATDADNDVLLYALEDGNRGNDGEHVNDDAATDTDGTATPSSMDGDSTKFSIDRMSGQLKVNGTLNFEVEESVADSNTYTVTVIATDPSGAGEPVDVTITVMDVNEAPVFDMASKGLTTLTVTEVTTADGSVTDLDGDADTTGDQATYTATDQESGDTVAYSVDGTDKKYFTIDPSNGELSFREDDADTSEVDEGHRPNYEAQSSYSITIVATSGAGDRAINVKLDVTVNVTDAEDTGLVSLSQREPQIGTSVTAKASDPDGGITGTSWVWHRSDAAVADPVKVCADATFNDNDIIEDATSSTYTPTSDDAGYCLRATAMYKDNIAPTLVGEAVPKVTEAKVQRSAADNTAPVFPDQDSDTDGDQSDETTREVSENTKAKVGFGDPIEAEDKDGDLLLHTLNGPDAASFGIDRDDGQLMTKAALDYETKSSYAVTVMATDPSGATDMITVTIIVKDENDDAKITGDASFDYAEDGMAPVATFSATDQDGDAIVWELSGADAGDFNISADGEFSFKASPNFEAPADADEDNAYEVTVQATGGSKKVTVEVTNEDEDGSASLNKPQPQVGRGLTASVSDPDGTTDNPQWQWARSMDGATGFTDITGATSATRSPVAADVGYYLRASVTYTDMFGAGKTASVVSGNLVEARTVANARPSFGDLDQVDDVTGQEATIGVQVTRTIDENADKGTNIGDPVSATDADNDVLLYALEDGNRGNDGEHVNDDAATDTDGTATPSSMDGDSTKFSIDRMSGQLKVNGTLNFEVEESVADSNTYTVTVIATDPSGAGEPVDVTITVMDVNEAPVFDMASKGLTTLTVTEVTTADGSVTDLDGDADTTGDQATYTATDQESGDTVAYSVDGTDKKYFTIDPSNGELSFREDDADTSEVDEGHRPNYEAQSSYSITIVATSGAGDRAINVKLDVTVNVTDAEDTGLVSLSQREPQIGTSVTAKASDPDGGITGTSWVWHRSDAAVADPVKVCADATFNDNDIIEDATSSTYTPTDDDAGYCLRATAMYKDNIAPTLVGEAVPKVTEAKVQRSAADNTAPVFPDQDSDTDGDQSDETTREVPENTKAKVGFGDPIEAEDKDGDLLLHTLNGPDAASFTIDDKGQLMTKAALDYETKSSYTVTVMATDPSGATDSIMVTINVTDEDDAAVISVAVANTAPAFEGETAERSVAEDAAAGDAVGAPVMATDADDDELTYTLGGDDAASFDIDGATGQISVGADTVLDYETTTSYTVTVMAMDDSGAYDMVTVTIAVTDVDEGYNADINGDGSIDRDEALAAVADYFADEITKAEVLAVIAQYFAE